jgi:hypothetical protein
MYFRQTRTGATAGASESSGEVSQYDSVEFDEDSGAFTLVRSQGPITTTSRRAR